jgi:hypothetical protein
MKLAAGIYNSAMSDWKDEIQTELKMAEDARGVNNEGRARVCARRAAGIAAREYLSRIGKKVRTPSAFDVLTLIAGDQGLPESIREKAKILVQPVDEDFKLPKHVDLIQEAKDICAELSRI